MPAFLNATVDQTINFSLDEVLPFVGCSHCRADYRTITMILAQWSTTTGSEERGRRAPTDDRRLKLKGTPGEIWGPHLFHHPTEPDDRAGSRR